MGHTQSRFLVGFIILILTSAAKPVPAVDVMPNFSDLSCFESSRAAKFYNDRIINEARNPSLTEEDRSELLLKAWGIVAERCNQEFKSDAALAAAFADMSCFEARRNAEDYSDPSINGILWAQRTRAGELATERCYTEFSTDDWVKAHYSLFTKRCDKLWLEKSKSSDFYKNARTFCILDAAAAANQLIDPGLDE